MKWLIRILDKFIGKRSEIPLEYRFFNILALMGISFTLYATTINFILGFHIAAIIAPLLMGIFSLILYRITSITKNYTKSTNIVLAFTTLIFYPFMWIINGGSHGSIPIFLVLQAGMIAVFLNRMRKKLNLWLFVVVIFCLLVIDYRFPELIVGYETEISRLLDIGVSLLLICFGIFLMISLIMKEYNYTIDELRSTQLQLKEANRMLELTSITDELSGVFNRRYIMSCLKKAVESNLENRLVSVIMFDIDHFKKINDTYGHGAGDRVIQTVCQVFKDNFRSSDTIGRIGGEEFLIILPGVNLSDAYDRAELIRLLVSQLKWNFIDTPITISGGVHTNKSYESIGDILEKVDKYLYKAKHSGRNQIMGMVTEKVY